MNPSNPELPFPLADRQRFARQRMQRQGLVGWVLFHPHTGIVLHLYRSLAAAETARPTQDARHGVAFRTLAVHASGRAYEHVDGRATRPAMLANGATVSVPLRRGHIEARRLPLHVRDVRSTRRA